MMVYSDQEPDVDWMYGINNKNKLLGLVVWERGACELDIHNHWQQGKKPVHNANRLLEDIHSKAPATIANMVVRSCKNNNPAEFGPDLPSRTHDQR